MSSTYRGQEHPYPSKLCPFPAQKSSGLGIALETMRFLNFEISQEKEVQKQSSLHLLVCIFVLQPLLLAERGRAPLTAQGFVSCHSQPS